jgi:peroxiredoxin
MASKRSTSRSTSRAASPTSSDPGVSRAETGNARPTAANTSRAIASLTPKQRAELATQATRSTAVRPASPPTSTRSAGTARKRVRQGFGSNPWIFGGTLLAVLAIAIAAVIFGTRASANTYTPGQLNNSNVPLAAGKAAPNFTLTASDGKRYSLSQFRGQVVLVEFFAPWCPHCRNETTVLNQVASVDAPQGVQVLSVTATPYGYNYEATGDTTPITMNDVTEFVSNYHVTYPAMLDTSLNVGNAYGVVGYPQMFLIDRNGNIAWNNGTSGEVVYTDLQSDIQHTLLVPLKTPAATPTATATAAK